MIAQGSRGRSGITLTEILIAILIMGVGLISLATLFPLGLLRLREATRNSRSGLTFESAADDMDARAVLYKPSFRQTWYGTRDPFVQDIASDGVTTAGIIASSPLSANSVGLSNGLPICYDPLWRSLTGVFPNVGVFDGTLDFKAAYAAQPANEARFGDGLLGGAQPYLRNDPDGKLPSAYGLQRLTNFIPWSSNLLTAQYPFTCINNALTQAQQPSDVAGDVFTSIDDIVFNPTGNGLNAPSSVLPDISSGGPQADYKYTWFFTGRQLDAGGNGAQFVGEVVVCDGRPFGFDPLPGNAARAPAGEFVVEAVFGFTGAGKGVNPLAAPNNAFGYAPSDRSVLLRWPNTMPDPVVRPGGWICDVTYERNVKTFGARSNSTLSAFARCNWYQVSKRTDPEAETAASSAPAAANYRRMVLTLSSPLKVRTLLNTSDGSPVHVNVALVMPSVINVFPRSFEVH
jgi:type II secretory pathway pseudopilin PulG